MINYSSNLKNITIKSLCNYLQKHGWNIDENFKNKNLIVYKKQMGNEKFSVAIPASEKFKDYFLRINDIIELLSELEGKSSNSIVKNILGYSEDLFVINNKEIEYEKEKKNDKDIISFRIISKLSKDGTIPLEYGSSVVEGLKKLILSAIFNEEHPKPYFLRASKSSYEKLFNYKLAQTEVGSYVFNIEIDSKVDEQLKINDDYEIESISEERKVIRRIQNGIRDIKKMDINNLLENGYKKGLNANMCDAILNLNIDNTDIKIESKVEWSEILPKPMNIAEKVILEKKDFYIVKTISEKYKETNITECSIKGKIIRLSNRKDSYGNTIERNIVIQTEIEGRHKNIIVELGDLDYKKACEAHKQDNDIVIDGELLKRGKSWVMNNSKNFKVLH